MVQSQTSPSVDDEFGITEERKKEWCLLAVSGEGHPTYMCMGCHGLKITVLVAEAKLPARCDCCKRQLKAPSITSFMARDLMVKGGHKNLIDGDP